MEKAEPPKEVSPQESPSFIQIELQIFEIPDNDASTKELNDWMDRHNKLTKDATSIIALPVHSKTTPTDPTISSSQIRFAFPSEEELLKFTDTVLPSWNAVTVSRPTIMTLSGNRAMIEVQSSESSPGKSAGFSVEMKPVLDESDQITLDYDFTSKTNAGANHAGAGLRITKLSTSLKMRLDQTLIFSMPPNERNSHSQVTILKCSKRSLTTN